MPAGDQKASAYEATVELRLEQVKNYLRDSRAGKPSSVVLPLWNLRALQDEGKQAGYVDLADLCRKIENDIMALETCHGTDLDVMTARILATVALVKDAVRRATGTGNAPVDRSDAHYNWMGTA